MSLAENTKFIDNLKTYLLKIDNLGMYYKTYILEYLKQHHKFDVIKVYIDELYGHNGSKIGIAENKVELHNVFCSYGESVEPQMMREITTKFKWDVVGYIEHKEYALQAPAECFDILSKYNPTVWQNSGLRLYRQSCIAEISNNRYASDICESIVKASIRCGLDDFWKLHFWDDEFRIDPELIYQSLFELIEISKTDEELITIWLLNCGIHSWYLQEDRFGSIRIFNACNKKAQKINADFKSIVTAITPQWGIIIEHETKEREYTPSPDSYTQRTNKEKNAISAEYKTIHIEELIMQLPNIPSLSHPQKRYDLILERLTAEDLLTKDNARKVLKSVCCYLRDKEWHRENFDSIIVSLFTTLGDEAFWNLAQTIKSNLSDYYYHASHRNMQFLLKIYCGSSFENIKMLFEREISTQESWITGNSHIEIAFELSPHETTFDKSNTLIEITLTILLEQIESQNARKVETAVYAIYCLGRHLPTTLSTIADNWNNYSELQKEFLLTIISRWSVENVDLDKLRDILIDEYLTCNYLSKKYYLHSILLTLGIDGISPNAINYNAKPINYTLPNIGSYSISSPYEAFLSLQELDTQRDHSDIRRYIAQIPCDENVRDFYAKNEDIVFSILNRNIDAILYGEERKERWDKSLLLNKKSRLLYAEDPFILTDMPQIIYDEEWFPHASEHTNSRTSNIKLDITKLSQIAHKNIVNGEILLAACIWYPREYKDGVVFYDIANIDSSENNYRKKQINWCIGNFGLLAREGALDEIKNTSIYHGGISLFNAIGGKTRFHFGNSQIAPSSAWRELLGCMPSDYSPYMWLDKNGNEVLRFECFASPIREATHEAYFRQPILFRWVCNSEWLNQKLNSLGLDLWFVQSIEKIPQ